LFAVDQADDSVFAGVVLVVQETVKREIASRRISEPALKALNIVVRLPFVRF
jgi:transcriptional regulator NrdR family protein